jgi:DNA mismatch repair protein MutS2
MDAILERADSRLAKLPAASGKRRSTKEVAPATAAREWRVGDEVRSASGGWTGRIAELDRSRKRATIEAGAMRVSVDVADLERVEAGATGSAAGTADIAGTNVAALRLARARSVPMSLDVRGARVDEALATLDRYLEDASLAGLERVTVIHGLGTGALRDAVRAQAGANPLVKSLRPGERGEGGDGATIVRL